MSRDLHRTRNELDDCCAEITFAYQPAVVHERLRYESAIRTIGGTISGQVNPPRSRSWAWDIDITVEASSNPPQSNPIVVFPAGSDAFTANNVVTYDLDLGASINHAFSMNMEPHFIEPGVSYDPPPLVENLSGPLEWTSEVTISGDIGADNADPNNTQPYSATLGVYRRYLPKRNYQLDGGRYKFTESGGGANDLVTPVAVAFEGIARITYYDNEGRYPTSTVVSGSYIPYDKSPAGHGDFSDEVTDEDLEEMVYDRYSAGGAEVDATLDATLTSSDGSKYQREGNDSSYGHHAFKSEFLVYLGRARFKIPDDHEGSWCEIEYELVLDDGTVETVEETNTIEWIGPGDVNDADDESWFTNWIEIALPESRDDERFLRPTRYRFHHSSKWINW